MTCLYMRDTCRTMEATPSRCTTNSRTGVCAVVALSTLPIEAQTQNPAAPGWQPARARHYDTQQRTRVGEAKGRSSECDVGEAWVQRHLR